MREVQTSQEARMFYFQKDKLVEFERRLKEAEVAGKESVDDGRKKEGKMQSKKKGKGKYDDEPIKSPLKEEETLEDKDSITYFNRKYSKDNKQVMDKDGQPLVIPGAFYKVRAQGGAAPVDSEQIGKLNKRSIASFTLSVFHSYCLTQFLYHAKIVTPARFGPAVYQVLAYSLYPMALVASVVYYFRSNQHLMKSMDIKYTPIWIEISQKDI